MKNFFKKIIPVILLFPIFIFASAPLAGVYITQDGTSEVHAWLHARVSGYKTNDTFKFTLIDSNGSVVEEGANPEKYANDAYGYDYFRFKTQTSFSSNHDTYVAKFEIVEDGVKYNAIKSFSITSATTSGDSVLKSKTSNSSEDSENSVNKTYNYLAKLPGTGDSFDIGQPNAIGNYFNTIFKVIIGLMGVIAVFQLVRYGILYMGESFTGKKEAKEGITNTIISIIIILCAVLLLKTINPKLVDMNLGVQKVEFNIIGRDIPQTVDKNGMVCAYPAGKGYAAFAGYKAGDPWTFSGADSDAEIRKNLLPIKVSQSACTTVNQRGCVSVGALDTAFVNRLYNKCRDNNCSKNIVITEGTGCWYHNSNPVKAHYPNGWTVDLQKTTELATYIHSWKKGQYFADWGQCYYFENGGLGIVEEGNHFHSYSLIGGCTTEGQAK